MVIHKVHPINFEKPHTYKCKINLCIILSSTHTHTHNKHKEAFGDYGRL